MSRRCPSVVSLKQILCFLLERCEVFSHWSDSSLFLCWRWNSAASQSGREEKDQTCSTKWRAEDVKLVSDAAISLQIPEWSQQKPVKQDHRAQTAVRTHWWHLTLPVVNLFHILFKIILLFTLFKLLFQGKNLSCSCCGRLSRRMTCNLRGFRLCSGRRNVLHLHISVADSTSGDTKEAQQAGDKRREDNVPNKQFCVQFLSLIKGQNWNNKHKRFCLDEKLIPFVCEEERNSAGRSCCNLCVFIGTCVSVSPDSALLI